jgi:hypothetical protein
VLVAPFCSPLLDGSTSISLSTLGKAVLSGVTAGFESQIAHSELDANFLEEVVRGHTTGKDPNEIVGNLLQSTADLQVDGVSFEFDGIRVEKHFELTVAHAVCDAQRVPFLDPAKTVFAIRKCDLVAVLVRQAHGGFDGAVSAAHDENFLVDVMVRLDQAVHHFGQFFAFDAELARGAGPVQRENYGA